MINNQSKLTRYQREQLQPLDASPEDLPATNIHPTTHHPNPNDNLKFLEREIIDAEYQEQKGVNPLGSPTAVKNYHHHYHPETPKPRGLFGEPDGVTMLFSAVFFCGCAAILLALTAIHTSIASEQKTNTVEERVIILDEQGNIREVR